jgi:hypothetical protein
VRRNWKARARIAELEGALRVIQRSLVSIDKAVEDDDTAQLGESLLRIANSVSAALAKGEKR